MSVRGSKARADRLVREARAARQSRQAHTARALAILRERISSPGGLALCFGLGAMAGYRSCGRTAESAHEDDGFLRRTIDGPVGSVAVRLAAATIVRELLQWPMPADADASDTAAAGDTPADSRHESWQGDPREVTPAGTVQYSA